MALTYLNSEMIEEPAIFDQLYVTSLTALSTTIQNTLTNNLTSFNVTDSSVISVNSVNDALRITQIGIGNALVVEDSESQDPTPFVVKNDGKVGVGVTTPSANLEVRGTFRTTSNFGTSFIVDDGGRVGIGTQTPNSNLNVIGDCVFTGTGQFNAINSLGNIQAQSVVLPVAGNGSIVNDATFLGNVTFLGGVSALSGLTVVSTIGSQSSALSVVNAAEEIALYVSQETPTVSPIAVFRGAGREAFSIVNPLPNSLNLPIATVNGILSSTGFGSSTNWNTAYTSVLANSASWGNGGITFTTVQANSATWNATRTVVQNTSANWNSTTTSVFSNSASWGAGGQTSTTVRQNSANWQSTYSVMQSNSSMWMSLSANYSEKYTYIPVVTANIFPLTGANLSINAANYRVDISGVLQEPGVDYFIAGSNLITTDPVRPGEKIVIVANAPIATLDAVIPDNSIVSNKIVDSGNWNTTYNTVRNLSSSWEESGDIIPTVADYLQNQNISISRLTVTNLITSTNTLTNTNYTIPRKYTADIEGNGSLTALNVIHNLGTRDIIVSVYDKATYENVITSITNTTVDSVDLTFDIPPNIDTYRIVIIG